MSCDYAPPLPGVHIDVITELRQARLIGREDPPEHARREVCAHIATVIAEIAEGGRMVGVLTRDEAAAMAEVGARVRERTARTYR